MAKKYVYFFGAGAAEGNMRMKDVLGGKGANLAEMAGIGLPVPPGFTISTEVCTLYYKNKKKIPEAVRLEVEKNLERLEKAVGQAFGDPEEPAPRLRPLRRPGLDAGHDGHHPQPRPQRQDGRGPRRQDRATSASPSTATAASSRCTATSSSVSSPSTRTTSTPSRPSSRERSTSAASRSDADLTADDLKDLVAAFKAAIKEKTGHEFPDDSPPAALGRDRRRLRLVDERPGHRLPQDVRHPRGLGHGRQRPAHGLRQHGRRLRHRRRLHPRPGHRRERLLRRVPHERPGRGRRRRHPDAQADRRAQEGRRPRPTSSSRRSGTGSRSTTATCRTSSSPSSAASSTCSRAASASGPAFAAVRIAVDMVGEKLISEKEALSRVEPDQLNQLLRPDLRPGREAGGRQGRAPPGQGPQRRARRRHGPRRLQRRRRRSLGAGRARRSSWPASRPRPRTSRA